MGFDKSISATDLTQAAQANREFVYEFQHDGKVLGANMKFTTSQSRDVTMVRRRAGVDYVIEKLSGNGSLDLEWFPEGEPRLFAAGEKFVIQWSQTVGACSASGVAYALG